MQHELIPVLKEDHAVLKDLSQRVMAADDFRKKQQLTNDLYLSLNSHMAVIEQSILPQLRGTAGPGLVESVLAQFEQLRELLSDLMAHRVEVHGLEAALSVLCPTLQLQTERERMFLLPAMAQAGPTERRPSAVLETGHRMMGRVPTLAAASRDAALAPRALA